MFIFLYIIQRIATLFKYFFILKVIHSFTDEDGDFVFGPLCPDRKYEIQVWVNKVKHIKVCAKCNRESKCLKSVDMKQCDCFIGDKKEAIQNKSEC